MPEYIGTKQYPKYEDYLISEIKAKQVKATGILYVQLIIDKDGSVVFLKLIKGDVDSADMDKLIAIFKSSPKWTPRKQNNIPVKINKVIRVKIE